MDIFFADPSEVPLPPNEVRLRQLKAVPSPDGRRLRVYLEVDPFQKRPSAELKLFDPVGKLAASVDIIETMSRKLELNMHLRGKVEPGAYLLEAVLFYADLPEPSEAGVEPVERQIVDSAQVTIHIEV